MPLDIELRMPGRAVADSGSGIRWPGLDEDLNVEGLLRGASAPGVAKLRRISAATVVEAAIVLQARYGDHGERELDLFLQRAEVDVIAVSEEHAALARQAFRRFGRGRHAAALNFGDCFSYALAVALDHPLLFVGTDFAATGVPRLG